MTAAAATPVSWATFEAAAPDLAAEGRALLGWGGRIGGLLATVRGEAAPRIYPVSVEIVDGRLLVFVLPSAKRTDLELDGRFALHAHQNAEAPGEFSVRGRAVLVADAAIRAGAVAAWSFEADETYELFELRLEAAVIGRRPTADDWPPRYATWTSPA